MQSHPNVSMTATLRAICFSFFTSFRINKLPRRWIISQYSAHAIRKFRFHSRPFRPLFGLFICLAITSQPYQQFSAKRGTCAPVPESIDDLTAVLIVGLVSQWMAEQFFKQLTSTGIRHDCRDQKLRCYRVFRTTGDQNLSFVPSVCKY